MNDTPKKPRVFLDTSVLLSGLNSALGGSGAVLALGKLERIDLVLSPEVLAEAERAIVRKFPLLSTALADLLLTITVSRTRPVTEKELADAKERLPTEDAPILAAAYKARVDVLLTLDKEFERLAARAAPFLVCPPGRFLLRFRARET